MPYRIMFHADNIDRVKLQCLFDEHDTDKNGHIGVNELEKLLVKLGVAPLTEVNKLNSASSDKLPKEPVAENEH
jgi:Ca2+-binding EF-hand superfamily protein